MPVSLGGIPALNPRTVYRDCLDHRIAAPWGHLPNSFELPLGTGPGEGWLLMARSSLLAISADLTFPDLLDLVFGDPTGSATITRCCVLSVECVVSGAREAEAPYLVRVADHRALLKWAVVDKAYNLRSAADGSSVTSTLNAGVAWTWAELVEDLWLLAPLILGTWPGLPFTPEGTPGDIELYQTDLATALQAVLDRLGCALRLEPSTDVMTIVRVGETDAAAIDALALLDATGRRVWDAYVKNGIGTIVPEFVRVLFRHSPHVRDGTSPWYALDRSRAGAASGSFSPGSYFIVEDELEALGGASPTNSSALSSRADERAEDAFRRLLLARDPLRVVYSGAVFESAAMPGAQITSVRWSETAHESLPNGGLVTEVACRGGPGRGSWPALTQVAGDSGSTTLCALAALQTTDCITATGPSNSVVLEYDSGTGHWLSADSLSYPGSSGTLNFWYADGRVHLSLGGVGYGSLAELLDCGDGCFRGGPLTGHAAADGADDCAGETFSVCLECVACPPEVTHTTPCAPEEEFPATLTLTITSADPGCACTVGSHALHWAASDGFFPDRWVGEWDNACPGTHMRVYMYCDPGTELLQLSISCDPGYVSNFAGTWNLGASTYDPLSLVFTGPGCCVSSLTSVTFTITE